MTSHKLIQLFALLLLTAAISHSQPPSPPTFKIAGHVVRHSDRRPVRGARVTIIMVEKRDRQLSVITGDNGEFLFYDLPAAKFELQVNDHGWIRLYQQLEGYSTAIVAGPGLDSEHVLFVLDTPAVVTGTVLDEDGEPVRNGMVYLFGGGIIEGKQENGMKGVINTNSNGRFHFKNLEPGTYYVAAFGRPWYAQNAAPLIADGKATFNETNPDLDVAFPLTYYSGASTPEGATPLKLVEGSKSEIQITLHAVPALHFTFEGIETQPNQQIQASLTQVGPGGVHIQLPVFGFGLGMGGVPPGDYQLTASTNNQNEMVPLGSQHVHLTVGATSVRLNEAAKTSISGKVVMDGGSDLPDGLGVLLLGKSLNERLFVNIAKDGHFDFPPAFPQMQEGRFSLRMTNWPDVYVQKVTVDGAPFANGEINVARGAQVNLLIQAAKGVSKVNGIVKRDGKPLSGAMVLLIPQEPTYSNFIPRDQSDADGTFTLNWAAPGRYTLVAIDDGHGLTYADPAVIKPFLAQGKVIDVPVVKDAQVEIEVQTRARPR